jgi:hypothetical protein
MVFTLIVFAMLSSMLFAFGGLMIGFFLGRIKANTRFDINLNIFEDIEPQDGDDGEKESIPEKFTPKVIPLTKK